MPTAEYVRHLVPESRIRDNYAEARLYRLSEPIRRQGRDYSYVCLSALVAGPMDEVLVFPATHEGIHYAQTGPSIKSFRPRVSWEVALEGLGYELAASA